MTQQIIEHKDTRIEQKVCRHCGAPSVGEFCCVGCHIIFDAIQTAGLSRFYDLSDISLGPGAVVVPSNRSFSEFDHEMVIQKLCTPGESESLIARISISGIHCAGCVWLLESLPKVEPGILRSKVNLSKGEVLVQYLPKSISLSKIAALLNSFGYAPSLRDSNDEDAASKTLLWRMGVAGFSAANTMMLAISLFQGLFTGISADVEVYFKWVSFLLTLPAIIYSAVPFYQTSFAAVRQGRFHLDQPLTLAFLSAFLLSLVNTVTNHPFVYYDSVCALIFLLLVGRFMQTRALERARKSSKASWSVLPEYAVVDGKSIPLEALLDGDLICISPGERVPVDGEVVEGVSEIDLSVITGESSPVSIKKGDNVFAGSLNISSPLKIRSEKVGYHSRIGRILAEIGDDDSKYANLGEKASKYFVPTVLLLSFVTFLIWIPSGLSIAINNSLALLIVTCPCALGIAAPAVMGVALGRASRKGILIRKPSALEALCEVKHVCFDKTGTLTTGDFVFKEHRLLLAPDDERVSLIKSILIVLSDIQLHHPISKATKAAAPLLPYEFLKTKDSSWSKPKLVPGKGVEITHENLGKVRLGTPSWISEELQIQIDDPPMYSSVLLAIENTPALFLCFEDEVISGAKDIISELSRDGITSHLISGDSKSAVMRVSEKLNFTLSNTHFRISPEHKIEIVRSLGINVAMVGDGVNDAGAMQTATVGIGVRGGIESTLEAASIYLLHGLTSFHELWRLSKRARSTVRLTLGVSLVYNLIGGSLAIAGAMNPVLAAVLMPLSSLTVIAIAIGGSK